MQRPVEESVKILETGSVFVYPTDTIWGIGCDATSVQAVENIYRIKKRPDSKSLIILVDGMEMLHEYVSEFPLVIQNFLKTANKPTTVIYNHPKGLASNVVAADDTVAIRIVQNEFCQQVIKKFGRPIVSTSANFSGSASPKSFDEIDPLLLKQADYIVNLPAAESKSSASQIIKLNRFGAIEFLRK